MKKIIVCNKRCSIFFELEACDLYASFFVIVYGSCSNNLPLRTNCG